MKIIYLGTPAFAVAPLKAIIEAGFDVVAVVTAPDKPAGRGMQIQFSPVKKYALTKNIPVLQPKKLKDPTFIEQLASFKADIQVVIAFRMLPEVVWNMPPKGTINLHASLLPDYRGAAPINWTIINGEKETGVTTFFLKQEVDTGDIIGSKKTKITPDMTAGELHDVLMNLGSELIVETLQQVAEHNYTAVPQGSNSMKNAPKIYTNDCQINWEQNSEQIRNLIRGLSPTPGAFTFYDGKVLKIYSSDVENCRHELKPGSIETDKKNYFKIACLDGFLAISDLQPEGKKRMPIRDFLNGLQNKV
ncbi:MAG: methionyl-tRNA formyltransferase [Sphingobacteriales bacterium]|nr:methionyl-tRNA formyltransferase [Sphingobacteriales bacterium]